MSEKIKSILPLSFPFETQDPFLFCAYHNDDYPQGTNGNMTVSQADLRGRNMGQDFNPNLSWRMYHGQTIPGFPYHPHRGFETITINKQGTVDHSDSLGAAGRFMEGDVQWMTAGKGVQHSEMFPLLHDDKPNKLEIFQIWLNLPRASKFVEPHFKMLWKEDIPVIEEENLKVTIIAGAYKGIKALKPTPDSWAASPENGVRVLTVELKLGAEFFLDGCPDGTNRSVFFYEGDKLQFDDIEVESLHHIQLKSDAAIAIKNNSNITGYLLVLEGKPIGEPVVQYGPFVMNSQKEIQEAIQDYQRTQFGGWPWTEREKVHAKSKGRFALHADGTEEVKS